VKAPKHYRSNPVEVTAIQWTGSNANEIIAFIDRGCGLRNFATGSFGRATVYSGMFMCTVVVDSGEWIVADDEGNMSIHSDTFMQSYTEVSE
jgi:hypothetical protein